MTEMKIDSKDINITHRDKIIFAEAAISKGDLINYYLNIANYILPHLKDRPLTIQCFPQGVDSEGYVRQHIPKNSPKWLQSTRLMKKDGGYIDHILCQNTASLLHLANQNMVAVHRWLSKYTAPNYPDIMVVDLDPPENRFDLACKGAKLLKESFEERGCQSHVMTTGSKGLHVLASVTGKKTFEETREFLRVIVDNIIRKYPNEFTGHLPKEKRNNLLYFDILRNVYGQTAITPYSVRPTKEASIATPLFWDEVDDRKLSPRKFTMLNIFDRLKNLPSDPWK